MLLKCTADGRRIKVNGTSVGQSNVARGMKMTMSTSATMSARVHRKVMRAPHKRVPGKTHPGKMVHGGKMVHPGKLAHPGKLLGKFGKLHYAHTHALRPPELCDNSNDSGLGPDHDHRHVNRLEGEDWAPGCKRRREMALKLECDDANDAYPFPPPAQPAPAPTSNEPGLPPVIRASCSISSPPADPTTRLNYQDTYRSCGKLGSAGKYASGGKLANAGGKLSGKLGGKLGGKYGGKLAQALARRRALVAMSQSGAPLAAPLTGRSRDGTVELQILCQPETQHRARYQTEGSRGAVKDNTGNGFPIVKLVGYDKPAVLQVFIGTDTGRVAPHMFYQACRVSGKNSTTCKERKDDGTVVIEIDLEPAKNWQVVCDCVGILKERNVDVEHRFGELGGPAAHASRGKKKSTRCRMVFRTEILNADGQPETLQVCSTQIICTQPPGVPEVCRKSLVSCPATGGLELYLLGKNFLKETRVVFCHRQDGRSIWEDEVVPDKEFLQQTHLVCCVPPYARADIAEPVQVQLFVRSGGKASEPHAFTYTPPARDTGPQHCTRHHTQGAEDARPVLLWGGALMPPPAPPRRPSLIVPDHEPPPLKAEADDSSQHSPHPDAGPDAPERLAPPLLPDDLKVVDLRLKAESSRDAPSAFGAAYDGIELSPPAAPPAEPSPLASFTQQLQAIQNQVQTDKMVESVTAAIFNSEEQAAQMYAPPMMEPMRRLMAAEPRDIKLPAERGLLYAPRGEPFNPFGAITKMEMETEQIEQRIAQQTAHMEALVEDAMKATAAMLPADAAKLDELVNSRADDHLAAAAPAAPLRADVLLSPGAAPALAPDVPPSLLCEAAPADELMMMSELPSTVKTPPAAVKSMILSAAAEILTSDSTMNALVTSAINTANILTDSAGGMQMQAEQPSPSEPTTEAPLSAMSQAVSQAVTQAVSQAVSHAVSQAVSQEMTAPVQGLTDMSDSDLLSYINPSTFDQV